MEKRFEMTQEQKDHAVSLIKAYFLNERDEAIGDLSALLFLDFISDKFGAFFYNMAVEDAAAFMSEKVEDLYSIEK